MIKKIATWIMTHRLICSAVIGVLSIFFAFNATRVKVKSVFNDLLPQRHPFIEIHNKYVNQLGDPEKIILMLQVREGDIYSYETLGKIKRITGKLDLIPGVDHNTIYSLSSRRVKKVTITPDAIITQQMMQKVPESNDEIERLKQTVRNTGGVYGVWVSHDEKSVLFAAAFISGRADYPTILKKVNEIIARESDAKHILYAAGEPILTGWVYFYQWELYRILGISFSVMAALLFFYFRNAVGVVVPFISSFFGIIWGVGFCGLMGYNLEPLTLVVPLLITARALSHSVQITERYFECYNESKQVLPACTEAATSQYPPGLLGILCDVIGIYLIAVAPLPIMQKLAYVCGFWALGIIPTGLVFTPILISFFPPPKNIPDIVDPNKGFEARILKPIAKLGHGKPAVAVFIGGMALFIITGLIARQVSLGDIHPGSPILWPDSNYNISIREIGKSFPGTEELYVIFEGSKFRAVREPDFLKVLNSFQRYMEKSPLVTGTLSVADFLPPLQKALFGGYPKKEILPLDEAQACQLMFLLTGNSPPGDFDRYFSPNESMANVIVWYRDHTGATLRAAIADVRDFVKKDQDQLAKAGMKLQLASGNIGILFAANEVVRKSQFLNLILVMLSVFALCTLTYRSMVAAVIIMIPLNLANLVTLSLMKALGIGLSVNTLPIVSVGVGTGIDYGIYLLSRMCEEYQKNGGYSLNTLMTSLLTTGKAIFFTNTTMCSGIIFFYFLSSLRFQAEMGLLLAVIMFMNMVGALILIPSIVYVFKPKFLGKAKLLVK